VNESELFKLAGIMGKLLLDESDDEQRCLSLASALRTLAGAVEDTDAYGPLMDVASDIATQAQRNIDARPENARRDDGAARRFVFGASGGVVGL